jgi:hypothetical protein
MGEVCSIHYKTKHDVKKEIKKFSSKTGRERTNWKTST